MQDGFCLGGFTQNTYGGDMDMLLIRTDLLGNLQWNKTYGGSPEDQAFSITSTIDGGYALAGSKGSHFWLVKTDAFGLSEQMEIGLAIVGYTTDSITLYRGKIDPYWNYVRVHIWVVKENP
jgi:hypothetical protein